MKYEFDKKSGALFVDRILHTPMRYPANYGFVPHTLSPDGDPLDALVDRPLAVHPGLRRPRPADRRAQPRGRAWRRREADLRAGRTRPSLITPTSASGRTCRRSCSSRSSISSPTTRTSKPDKWVRVGQLGRCRRSAAHSRVEAIERARRPAALKPDFPREFSLWLRPLAGGGARWRPRTASISRAARPRSRSCAEPPRDPEVAEAHRKLQRAYLERASVGDRPASRPSRSAELSPRRRAGARRSSRAASRALSSRAAFEPRDSRSASSLLQLVGEAAGAHFRQHLGHALRGRRRRRSAARPASAPSSAVLEIASRMPAIPRASISSAISFSSPTHSR